MPDITTGDCGEKQLYYEDTGEQSLPTSVASVAPCSHRQRQDAHVTLLCSCFESSSADATTQSSRTIRAAAEPAPQSPGVEDGVISVNAQQHVDELLSIQHHTQSRWGQVSKQLNGDPRCRRDHIRAGCCLRLESKFRGCDCEQRHSVRPGFIAEMAKHNRSACAALGECYTLYHQQRGMRTQGSALQLR